MFHSSTQKQHWMFKNEEELEEIRKRANLSFCEEHSLGTAALDPSQELELFRYYQKKLVELCNLYAPPKWLPLPRTALVSPPHDVVGCVECVVTTEHCRHLLQEVLPPYLSDGVPPSGHLVRSGVCLVQT